MARITINGVSLDPADQRRGIAGAAPDASASNYVLVQTHGPLEPRQRTALEQLGVQIQEYVPESTYLCAFAPTDLDAVRGLEFVEWANVYLRGFKITPALLPGDAGADARRDAAPSPSRIPREVDVVFHQDVDPAAQVKPVAAAAGVDPNGLAPGRDKIRLVVEQGRLDELAALDAVHHIELVPRRKLHNDVARPILHADVSVAGTPYKGKGQVVAVADTGFDRGSKTDVHPAFTGRVKRLYALGRTSPARTDDPDGHGTHVCGSTLGGGAIAGTAPEATLVMQSMLDTSGGLGGIPTDLRDLFTPPYKNDGARVHTNSWGAVDPGLPYDASAREIDAMVWDNPDLVICFAAGNSGTDGDGDGRIDGGSVGSEAAAKNCITVGASESKRTGFKPTYGTYWPSDFPANPIRSDKQANDPDGMVAFSSRGPTQEQRISPDVVAPGTCILSTLSRRVASPSTSFGVSTDAGYFFDSGTSMATPLVAGCTAVLRETLVRNGKPKPTAALIKALLISGAVELPGQYTPSEAGASPNNDSGFGRVNLAGSVIVAGPDPAGGGYGEGKPLKQGGETTVTVTIPKRAARSVGAVFKVTLVWTDPPGAALQNDLDLIVRAADGTERHGNMGTRDGFDRHNNVEQVVWTNMPSGDATITIRAFRITQFAQPYAYAWRLS